MERVFVSIVSFVSLLFLVAACTRKDNALEYALTQAGNNRTELEKVLRYYSHSPEDSLKYRAACFLIEHMPQYYYYEGDLLECYLEYYKLLYMERKTKPQVLLDSLDKQYGGFFLEALEKKYDIQEIDSAYLCHNIEWSFKVWQEMPWNKHVAFRDFCEFILPYRLGNEKPTYWKEELYNRYISLYGNMRHIPDIDNPVTAARILTDTLRKSYRFTTIAPPAMPRLGPQWSSYLCGSCQDITDYTMYACRALGIACHLDFLPIRGDGNSSHFWISYTDKAGGLHVQDFLGHIMPVRSSHLIRGFSKLKAYRYTFSRNVSMLDELHALDDAIYPFFEQGNFVDVTVYYADCFMQTLSIPSSFIYETRTKSRIAYLCLASRTDWVPVAWAEFDRKRLRFDNVSKGCVARVATWENDELVYQTPPFQIASPAGELTLFQSQDKQEKVVLLSKTNLTAEDMFRKRMIHGVFEGSNDPNFAEKDTLHHIVTRPKRLLTTVAVYPKQAYRYVRYFGPNDGFCNISEIAFFAIENDSVPLRGEIIGTPGSFNNSPNVHTNAFDGKTDTSFDYKSKYGGWVGLDLGTPQAIAKIVYTPRNRDNYIRPGDTYELFYAHDRGWQSLGIRQAKSDSLLYDNVPVGSLLYVRNHTRGVDERIFMYKEGKQIWL